MCNKPEAIRILREVFQACSNIIPVSDAFLYGSYARGDYDSESDVDIFLTTPLAMSDIEKNRRRIAHIAGDLSLDHDVSISVCVRPQELFQPDHSPYYASILRDGIKYHKELAL